MVLFAKPSWLLYHFYMKDFIIVSDFDGTITSRDSLYFFFKEHAKSSWLEVEKLWVDEVIDSKECLKLQFELVEGLNEELIEEYTSKIELDPYFREFNNYRIKKDIDFVVVSDGVDYFIKKILQKNNIENIKIISNHAEFTDGKFNLTFPNSNPLCKNNAATCKCAAINNLRNNYKKIIYAGDGVSDFCVSKSLKEGDILFAKDSLLIHAKKNNIPCIEFKNFKNILDKIASI